MIKNKIKIKMSKIYYQNYLIYLILCAIITLLTIFITILVLFLFPKSFNRCKNKNINNSTKENIKSLEEKILLNPYNKININPFKENKYKNYKEIGVCGVKYTDKNKTKYYLKSYQSYEDAIKDNAYVTHYGKCGACSTLQDLSVYLKNKNLTKKTRRCGFKSIFNKNKCYNCIKNLGFTEPCAKIWYYNTINTKEKCMLPCLWNIDSTYTKKNNKLNKCLECDEKVSGTCFKNIAGRTRRNSGIISEINRNANEMQTLKHTSFY